MNAITIQSLELPAPVAVLERTWRATWFVGESKLDHGIEQQNVYTSDQMHQYARDYAAALSQTAGVADGFVAIPKHYAENVGYAAAMLENSASVIDRRNATALRNLMSLMLAAAPAASGGEDDRSGWCRSDGCVHKKFGEPTWKEGDNPFQSSPHPDALPDGTLSKSTAKRVDALAASSGEDYSACCDTPAYCSSVRRCTAKDSRQPPAAASVSERARALLAAEYRSHGWHEDAGRLCMGGDPTSFVEDDALRVIDRLIEQGDEDAHVITELGRLLASIAVILKGPEPAGTAWSYHDLPSLVASEVAEPRQVAAEMKAWAHTKMAEQQSSRRDRMMVVEWAKRLLPESSFPVKDFDVEGMSITKEAAREAVKRVALEQALTQQRGEQLGDFQDKAMAWDAVCDALGSVSPMWSRNGETGLLAAVNTIRSLATTTPQPSADAVREIYDAAAKGFHTSETNGAERKYLHVIRFQSIEDLHGYEDAWTAAMVKARDAK